jgi:uncharacterized paraquat-inducible protein A
LIQSGRDSVSSPVGIRDWSETVDAAQETLFMSDIIPSMFFVVFGLAVAGIISGFFRTARMSSKIFEVVERELDKQLANSQTPADAPADKVHCEHCGCSVPTADKCPNCGANLT